jgi:phospholipid/cholesterol/gamma-HCH transport system permease protein
MSVARPKLEDAILGSGPFRKVSATAEMGTIAALALAGALTPPFEWRRSAIGQFTNAFRRSLAPVVLSVGFFALTFLTIIFGQVIVELGASDRMSSAFFIASVREIDVWVTAMVFAGLVGSSMCADLGARKIREELDALAVLGVDRYRSLAVPRVIAVTAVAPVLGFIGLFVGTAVTYVVAPLHFNQTVGVFRDGLVHAILPVDLIAYFVKFVMMGFLVGVVACQRGLSAGGGADGVGRAVNETVVISFVGIWVLNVLFNLAFLTLFPDASVLRG